MKILLKKILFSLSVFLIGHAAYAAAIVTLTPSITSTNLRADGLTEVIYTATNGTNTPLSNITIDPTFNTSGNRSAISVQNNNCSTLAVGASCTFQVLMFGSGQPASFQISPRVCAFNGAICSQPIAANRLNVSVLNNLGTVFAYVVLDDTLSLLPINASNFSFGTALAGFASSVLRGIAVSKDGTRVYIVNSSQNTVRVTTGGANPSLVATISVGSAPTGIAVTPDDTRVYVTNVNADTVSVINAVTNTVIQTINVGSAPAAAAVSPDGSKVYVVNNGGTVSVINTATNTVVATINVGNFPREVTFTPDGARAYVTNDASNSVSVINTATNSVVTTISSGGIVNPFGIVASPDGSKVYVANFNGTISVINTSTNTVITTFNVGNVPLGVALTPRGDRLFVSSGGSNNIAVINTANNSATNINLGQTQSVFQSFVG